MRNLIARAPTITRARSRTMSGGTKIGTLLVHGSHRESIVSQLAQVLNHHGARILDSDHYSDAVSQTFLQRIQFDLLSLTADRATLEAGLRDIGERFGMGWRISYPDRARRVAIFASKQEHCLYDLLIRHRAKELACDISMVISNHVDAAPIAAHFGVPFHHLPITADTKQQQEAAVAELIDCAGVDLIVLARYMQILSPTFVARYPSRIINIHHSFLPAFSGANPYKQAHEKGVKMIGATSHYVTAELDQGPIIEQGTVRCAHRDTVEDLVRKGRDLEKNVLAAAVRWHLDDRVLVYAGKTVIID
ncbi:MAG: formyltetrahydrofolate deformylase [Deltaproteobacteria bacterium]|nr:formyltetrahydrofolate deformylase [Deltaproteobacteria bacterium]